MSVYLDDYVKQHYNVLAEIVDKILEAGIILAKSEIEVCHRCGETWTDIHVGHTLTCNDLRDLLDILDGWWWCISPLSGTSDYRLSINFKTLEL